MRKNLYPGLYIVLEGIECSGKGTQIDLLKKTFWRLGLKEGIDYNFFKEPTPECDFYEVIMGVLEGEIKTTPVMLQEYMAINRNSFEEKFLFDSLENVAFTVTDRSFYSNFVYWMVHGGEFDYIWWLNTKRIIPDVVIFPDISARESVKRLNRRKGARSIHEPEDVGFADKLRNIYLELFKNPKIAGEVTIFKGAKPEKKIAAKILRTIRRKAEKKGIFLLPKGKNV